MGREILDWGIKLLAWMCILKPKKRIWQLFVEWVYCTIISMIVSMFGSLVIFIINGNESIKFDMIYWRLIGLLVVLFIYWIFENREKPNTIQDYMLLSLLYIEEYERNRKNLEKLKTIMFWETVHFILLFVGILWWSISFVKILKIDSIDIMALIFGVDLCAAYVIFVYGKFSEEVRTQRKTLLRGVISFVWLVVVCIRIHQYWKDTTQVGLEDMIILLFSVIFTIPTICGWLENVPSKIIDPYRKNVNDRKKELLKECLVKKEKSFLSIKKIHNQIQTIEINIVYKWKSGEKKKVIKFTVYIVGVIGGICGIIASVMYISNQATIGLNKCFGYFGNLYNHLNSSMQDKINKGLTIVFLAIMLVLFSSNIPNICKGEKTKIQKLKDLLVNILMMIAIGWLILTVVNAYG